MRFGSKSWVLELSSIVWSDADEGSGLLWQFKSSSKYSSGERMNRLSAFLAVVAAMACGTSQAPAPVVTPQSTRAVAPAPGAVLSARIPSELEGFKLTAREAVSGAPADSAFPFSDGSPTILTVFVYGVAADVKVDADSQKWTSREGEKFKVAQEIQKSRGQIAKFSVAFSDTTRFAAGERSILEHRIAIPVRFPNGAVAVEFEYLYLVDGRFVKVRATVPEQDWQKTHVALFARALATRMARAP